MKQTQNQKINKHTQAKEHQGFMWFGLWSTSTGNDEEISLIKYGDIQVGVSIFSHTSNPQYTQ